MSAMDELFGLQPGRPDHPDLWRLVSILLQLTGAVQAGERVLETRTAKVVHLRSLQFFATERARLVDGPLEGEARQLAKLRGAFVEGWTCGYLFASGAGFAPGPGGAAGGQRWSSGT